MIMSLFRKDPADEAALVLYDSLVEQSRKPEFYSEFGAPDTVEGRFEVLTIHVYLLLRRLKGNDGAANKLAQRVFDAFFRNMDDSLREMGVGDMSIGRKIRAMAESFYGRAGAYEKAMEKEDADKVRQALTPAISRNVFGEENAGGASYFAAFMIAADGKLAAQSLDEISSGKVTFPPLETPPGSEQ